MPSVKFIQEAVNLFNDGNEITQIFNESKMREIKKRDSLFNVSKNSTTFEDSGNGIYYQRYAPWALSRLSSPILKNPIYPYGEGYKFKNGGKGVVIYVIDSGINIDHREFEGRASFGPNKAFDSKGNLVEDGYDYIGHGTAAASMVGGATFGVAKKAKIISYKVIGRGIRFTTDRAVKALSEIAELINNADDGRIASIVTCSYLSFKRSPLWDSAVSAFANLGYIYVVSAGNNNSNACDKSPISSLSTISVGSTDSSDGYQSTTNFGKCVDLYAPGVNVYAASRLNNYGTVLSTGTSYSAPLVAGICALILGDEPYLNITQLKSKILSISAKGVLKYTLKNSVNILAQALS
ncbi:Alkaline protease 2 [Smittium culicis]|uniref:Alkaline protease 2 n=1 Tax=Smittium culicis TaxID=133412 RepID=A0A1R1YG04_9FUNG|nr:Alkaline protease 2 [Smittium culicis]